MVPAKDYAPSIGMIAERDHDEPGLFGRHLRPHDAPARPCAYWSRLTDDVDVVCGRASKLQWRDGVLAVTRTRRKRLQQLDTALADDRYQLLLGDGEHVVAGPVRVIVADADVERSRLRLRCDRRVSTTRGIILTDNLGLAGIKDGDEWVKRR